jgi:hypothetical protein
VKGDVVDVEAGELARAKGARLHGLSEVHIEQRGGTFFARPMRASDAALERADACVLIGSRCARVATREADRDARASNRARPVPSSAARWAR